MKMDVKALALAGGIVCGGILFICTWWLILMDGASCAPVFLSKIYRGYSVSPVGSFIGLLWASVDGAAAGACFAWLYNQMIREKKSNGGEKYA